MPTPTHYGELRCCVALLRRAVGSWEGVETRLAKLLAAREACQEAIADYRRQAMRLRQSLTRASESARWVEAAEDFSRPVNLDLIARSLDCDLGVLQEILRGKCRNDLWDYLAGHEASCPLCGQRTRLSPKSLRKGTSSTSSRPPQASTSRENPS
jgi:hypothetical protein